MTGFADLFFRSSKTPKEASAGYAFRNTLRLCEAQSEVRFFMESVISGSCFLTACFCGGELLE